MFWFREQFLFVQAFVTSFSVMEYKCCCRITDMLPPITDKKQNLTKEEIDREAKHAVDIVKMRKICQRMR